MNYKTILVGFLAVVLVSCSGTQIQITEAIPAAVNMHRDATIMVGYTNAAGREIANYLEERIQEEGYYTLVEDQSQNPEYCINLDASMSDPTHHSVRCRILHLPSWRILYDETFSQSWKDTGNAWKNLFTGNFDEISGGPAFVASKIYDKLAPHEKAFKTRIHISNDNVKLREAVRAFRRKEAGAARILLQQSLQQNPHDAEACYMMALLESSESNYERSNQFLERAIQLDPTQAKYKKALQQNITMKRNETYVIQQLSE